MAGEFDILILLPLEAAVEFTEHNFIRGNPVLSHPMNFIRGDADLEAWRFFYLRGAPALQGAFENYVNAEALMQARVDSYIRGDVNLGLYEVLIKGAALLAARDQSFIRGQVEFAYASVFIKGLPALVRAPNLDDLGDSPPATKSGVLSRQYLSIAAVKKEIT